MRQESTIIFGTLNLQRNEQRTVLFRDKRGVSGASGQVDNHYDKVALGLLMTTALGAGVRMTQGTYDPHSASMAQEFGNSLAQETMRLGNKITDKMLSVPPTIVKRLNVFVEQDLHLRPYRG